MKIKTHIQQVARSREVTSSYRLQKALDIQPSVAARLWKDDFKVMYLETLEKLCEKLNCTPGDLITYEPGESKAETAKKAKKAKTATNGHK